jgi:hypothetical protein
MSDTAFNFMEYVAIALHLSRYLLAVAGIALCVMLFQGQRHIGWLVLGFTFTGTFWFGLWRVVQGRPFLGHRTSGITDDGLASMVYRIEFPLDSFLMVLGLYLLLRAFQRKASRERTARSGSESIDVA